MEFKVFKMNSLVINFLKRAVVVPLLVSILAGGVILFGAPRAIARSSTAVASADTVSSSVDLTDYSTRSYNSFKQLKNGDLVATISSEDIQMGEKAVVYSEAENSALLMSKQSAEPWKNGSVLITGANTSDQFKALHAAEKGTVFKVSFYDNEAYTYRLKKVVPAASAEELASYMTGNNLVLCLAYNDFTDLGNAYYYQVFVAEMV